MTIFNALIFLARGAGLCLLYWAPLTHAQSLQSLYEAARAFDATYLSAKASLDSATFKARQAEALNLPTVGLGLSGARAVNDTPSATTIHSQSKAVSATLSGKQTLFNAANRASVAQAQKALEVSAADFESAEQDLILRVSQAYFDVLAAQDALATTRASKVAITAQLASAKRNFEVGTATITDTREAQARFDLASAQEIATLNDLQVKSVALDQLVGRTNVKPDPLATPVVLPGLVPSNIDDWVQTADQEHPQVRRAQLGLELAQLETKKAQAAHYPTLDLSANVSHGRTANRGETSVALTSGAIVQGFGNAGPNTTSNVALTLNMPVFAGFAIQNRLQETLFLEEKARHDVAAVRRGVSQGTRQAFLGVQSGQAQVKALEAAESSTQLALEATQLGYKVGVRVNLDVLNAQTQLFTTQRDLAKARYDVLLGGLKLRQAAGQLKPTDVTQVDGLLKAAP